MQFLIFYFHIDIYIENIFRIMSLYLKLFENHNQYTAYTASTEFIKPNVSSCVQDNEVHYSPLHDYSQDYLTTVALEEGTISFNIWKNMGTDMITSISYSTDNGETWTTTNNTNSKSDNLAINVNVNEGDKVLWKGDAQQMGYYDEDDYDDYVGSFFSSNREFDVEGNVMSLLYGDNFKGEDTLEYDGQFACLFYDYDEDNECNVVNARNLSLPATTLANYCYYSMFRDCQSLATAPSVLPATTLAEGCYNDMFHFCRNLTTAPELPATTLTNSCYNNMFQGCASLNYIKAMFTTAPSTTYTNNWVNGIITNGIFVKNSAATWNVRGDNGIPTRWTVETASA